MPKLNHPFHIYLPMLRTIMERSLVKFEQDNKPVLLSIANNINIAGAKLFKAFNAYINNNKEVDFLKKKVDKKREAVIDALEVFENAINYIYGKNSEGILYEISYNSKTYKMSQKYLNEYIIDLLNNSKKIMINNELASKEIEKLETVVNDYSETDKKYETAKKNIKYLRASAESEKAECNDILRAMVALVESEYKENSKEVLFHLGFIFTKKQSPKRDNDINENVDSDDK